MFKNRTPVRKFFQILGQIILAIATCTAVSLIMKFTLVPLLLSLADFSEVQVHAIRGIVSLIAFSVGYLLYVKFYEKRKANELALRGSYMLSAIGFGAGVISITILPLFALGYYKVTTIQPFDEVVFAVIGLTTQAVVGALIFIGIFYRLIEPYLGTKFTLLLLSILLGMLNILIDGLDILVLLSSILINALWFGIYVFSRNLWAVGLANGAWLSTVFAVGILDEHWRASAPILSSYMEPAFLTGGKFGPEHSVITIISLSACLFLLLRLAKSRGLVVKT